MRTGQLYPREKREDVKRRRAQRLRVQEALRPWRVDYDLAYDGGGSQFTMYYRTYIGARISAFWHAHIASWGGAVYLYRSSENGMF